jgi:hypothetical protein
MNLGMRMAYSVHNNGPSNYENEGGLQLKSDLKFKVLCYRAVSRTRLKSCNKSSLTWGIGW